MKTILIFLFCLLLQQVEGQSPQIVKGSGYVLTQQRETDYFNSIEVSQHISVAIVQGEFQPITVEADDNLFPYIKTVVRNSVLKIYISDTVNIVKYADLNVLISMPTIRSLYASNNSHIDATPQLWKINDIQIKASENSQIKLHLEAENTIVNGRTSAFIELKGKTRNLKAQLKTAAYLEARNLQTNEANLEMAIGAKAEINVIRTLAYNLSGNARLIFRGTPTIEKSQLSSGSKIIWRK